MVTGGWFRLQGWRSRRRRCPSGECRAQPEGGKAGEVLCGGEEVEVGVDFASAAHPGTASAVAAAHQVADLAFHFGAGGAVVVGPVGVVLVAAGGGEVLFVTVDGDLAAGGRGGALGAQRTAGAGVGEVGDAITGATLGGSSRSPRRGR